jgi:glycosyltransferase involved in cell wall biosynthesis
MTTLPRITVVTPSYNQSAFLERTLRSVLDQRYPNLQYIVMDGGSQDGSEAIIRRYADQLDYWVSQPDAGQSDAINQGFARADGEIMTWLNSDDVLLPGALHTVGELFVRFPHLQWITGQPANTDPDDHLRRWPIRVAYFQALIRRGWYHGRALGFIRQEGTFWRRSLWQQIGAQLEVSRRYTMDYALWRQFAIHAPLVAVDQPLAAFRHQAAQKTHDLAPYYKEAGITLPHLARYLTLPCRAVITLFSWQLAPHVPGIKVD